MKTMRYRIRVITLVVVCSLLLTVLWTAKEAWFPAAGGSDTPAESVSSLPPDPWTDPAPSSSAEPAGSPAETDMPVETPSAGPLFDTFGL